jgi:riboflavin biosynthesis pyrimidine reductase
LLPPDEGEPDLEAIYAFPDPGPGGRHVRANFVTSADGAIEVGGRSGPLGGPGDKQIFHLLRALSDVILVGAGTARTEGYGAPSLPAPRRDARRRAGQLPVPPLAVVTARGLEPDARLLVPSEESAPPLVLTTAAAASKAPREVRERAELVICGDDRVDLERTLDALSERGLTRILCEGGPRLVTDLMAIDRLDELCLTLAPVLGGPERARLTSGEPWTAARGLTLVSVLEDEGDLFLRYLADRSLAGA